MQETEISLTELALRYLSVKWGARMTEHETTGVIQQIYEAFGRGDLPAVLGALADDVEWSFHGPSSIPFGGTRRGREEVEQFFRAIAEHVEVDEFGPRGKFIAQDDTVVVLGHERMRAKSTGAAWETDWVHVWTLRDGKVVQVHEFSDTAAIVDAIFLSEPMV